MEDIIPSSKKNFLERWWLDSIPTDKNSYHSYAEIYDTYLNNGIRNDNVCLLEIGVCRGGSLMMFRKYFSAESFIIGIDASAWVPEFRSDPNIITIKGIDSTSDDSAKKVIQELESIPFKGFHIIVDDGDHRSESQHLTFKQFYPHLLKGGYYFIEDVKDMGEAEFYKQWDSEV
eukprot:CAMPEP_0197561404 /NCGR_PEP_ID=MMETSP1320-20131121/25107_1 /TAXON_ID=91990 /ORGANISM="Bolidomonas sp., Strain RCC2347" /LENGTH=173 /DNA_ID=CAMNT_0043123035 /DNA_START=218 /DNA_END=735 /DNA_ORIENTATION=-